MKEIKILLFLFCFSNLTFAQKSEVGNWLIYLGNQKINQNFNWHNEVQYRSFDFFDDTNQLLLRTGIGYDLTENNTNLLLGYAFINTQNYKPYSDQKASINEHRIYQQFISKQNFGGVFIQHRYRVEERFIADNFKLRFRYFSGINIPLNKKVMDINTIYISMYNEIFINADKPLFDRNRLYAALGFVINKNFKIETGFMAQTLENSNRNQVQIAIFNNLPL